jgi:hypothetical protein
LKRRYIGEVARGQSKRRGDAGDVVHARILRAPWPFAPGVRRFWWVDVRVTVAVIAPIEGARPEPRLRTRAGTPKPDLSACQQISCSFASPALLRSGPRLITGQGFLPCRTIACQPS